MNEHYTERERERERMRWAAAKVIVRSDRIVITEVKNKANFHINRLYLESVG